MSVNTITTLTTVLNNEVFVIPAGARNIDLYNSGGTSGKFRGNATIGGKSSVDNTLLSEQSYSLAPSDKPYGEIRVDATGTTIEVTANY